jgi:hypothetical protein
MYRPYTLSSRTDFCSPYDLFLPSFLTLWDRQSRPWGSKRPRRLQKRPFLEKFGFLWSPRTFLVEVETFRVHKSELHDRLKSHLGNKISFGRTWWGLKKCTGPGTNIPRPGADKQCKQNVALFTFFFCTGAVLTEPSNSKKWRMKTWLWLHGGPPPTTLDAFWHIGRCHLSGIPLQKGFFPLSQRDFYFINCC